MKAKKKLKDFTLQTYKKLLSAILQSGYRYMTFAEYIQCPADREKMLILRHDVDKEPLRSLRIAKMENELGINGTYYFRVVKNQLPKEVIENISKLGHEIGYHYDDLNAAGGVVENALVLFQKNLAKLRELAPIKTACMHGSPLSKHDNRDLWKNFDYHELGIIAEPYFDVDFGEVLYLTDTGRRWDGDRVSIRDKVRGERSVVMGKREDINGGAVCDPPVSHQESVDSSSSQKSVVSSMNEETANKLKLHSTMDIINALENGLLPSKIMLTVHPQRWKDQWLPWIWELCWQNMKNGVKYFVVKDNW